MTKEFKILFHYNHRDYNARVVCNTDGARVNYAVRPKATSLVRNYGKQILIFKENGAYGCESHLNQNLPAYIDALVNALREQDAPQDYRLP